MERIEIDEELHDRVTDLARVHTAGDAAAMIRLLLMRELMPIQFEMEEAARKERCLGCMDLRGAGAAA